MSQQDYAGDFHKQALGPDFIRKRLDSEQGEEVTRLRETEAELSRWRQNPIDMIARSRGWLPLTPGETMVVHFGGVGYTIACRVEE